MILLMEVMCNDLGDGGGCVRKGPFHDTLLSQILSSPTIPMNFSLVFRVTRWLLTSVWYDGQTIAFRLRFDILKEIAYFPFLFKTF